MKLTTITKMKNGQCITTVPKAWLEAKSLSDYDLLEWRWGDDKKKIARVEAFRYRCSHVFINDNGTSYQCILARNHKEWHKYEGIETVPK